MTDKMSNKYHVNALFFKLPWYKEALPSVDEVVLGQVSRIDQNGVYVQLLNYSGAEGFIAFHELSKRRVINIKSILNVGDVKLLLVLNVDSRGYVDLSNKYIVDSEDEEVIRYNQHSQMIKILHHWLLGIANKSRETFSIDLDLDDWKKVMNLTLWNYESGEAMTKFMSIAANKSLPPDSFPELYQAISANELGTTFTISLGDFEELKKYIDQHIHILYELKLRLNVVTWAIKPTNLLKQVASEIIEIMNTDVERASVILTAPEYQFSVVDRDDTKLNELMVKLETHVTSLVTRYPDCSFRLLSLEVVQKN